MGKVKSICSMEAIMKVIFRMGKPTAMMVFSSMLMAPSKEDKLKILN